MNKLLLIGEAYGKSEDLFKHPFVGSSGCELAKMLNEAKLAPELPFTYPSELDMIKYWKNIKSSHNIYLTNVFNERPPNNSIDFFFGNKTEDVVTNLAPYKRGKLLLTKYYHYILTLHSFILNLNPDLIITLGATALWALTNEPRITLVRGTFMAVDLMEV